MGLIDDIDAAADFRAVLDEPEGLAVDLVRGIDTFRVLFQEIAMTTGAPEKLSAEATGVEAEIMTLKIGETVSVEGHSYEVVGRKPDGFGRATALLNA